VAVVLLLPMAAVEVVVLDGGGGGGGSLGKQPAPVTCFKNGCLVDAWRRIKRVATSEAPTVTVGSFASGCSGQSARSATVVGAYVLNSRPGEQPPGRLSYFYVQVQVARQNSGSSTLELGAQDFLLLVDHCYFPPSSLLPLSLLLLLVPQQLPTRKNMDRNRNA
jgi:hypothetical protein